MKQTYTKHCFHEGMHIGRLTLLTYHRGGSQHHRSTERGWFSCRCDCGRSVDMDVQQLTRAKYLMCRDCRSNAISAAWHDRDAPQDCGAVIDEQSDWIRRMRNHSPRNHKEVPA